MVKIPWIVYAVVGAGMVFVLRYLDNPQLNLFRYVAYIFLMIAVFKLLLWFMLGKRRKELEPRLSKKDMPPEEPPKASFVCPYCKTPLPPAGRFCPS